MFIKCCTSTERWKYIKYSSACIRYPIIEYSGNISLLIEFCNEVFTQNNNAMSDINEKDNEVSFKSIYLTIKVQYVVVEKY